MVLNFRYINQRLDSATGRGEDLSSEEAIDFFGFAERAILRGSTLDRIIAVDVLIKVSTLSQQTDWISENASPEFFRLLFELGRSEIDLHISQSILKLLNIYFSQASKSSSQVLVSILRHLKDENSFLETIMSSMSLEDISALELFASFVIKSLTTVFSTKSDEILIDYVISFLETNVFSKLCLLFNDLRTQCLKLPVFDDLGKELRFLSEYLSGKLLNTEDTSHVQLIHLLSSEFLKLGGVQSKESSTEMRIKINEVIDREEISLLSAVQLLCFLFSSSVILKKHYYEYNLFSQQDSILILFQFSSKVCSLFFQKRISSENLRQVPIELNKTLFQTLITRSLEFWTLSIPELNDSTRTTNIITLLFIYFRESLNSKSFAAAITSLSNLDLDNLKRLELEEIHKQISWVRANAANDFIESLNQETLGFVTNRSFLQLSKGSWVYSEHPLDAGTGRKKSYYFLSLSSDAKALIYKRFSRKHSKNPNIDQDGSRIEFNQILSVDSVSISKKSHDSNLVRISSRMQVSRIQLRTRNNNHFSFYVETDSDLNVWLDGLKMLTSLSSNLSHDTRNQVSSLISLREDAQFLDLDSHIKTHQQKYEEHESAATDNLMPSILSLRSISKGFAYN
ncbi:hypothetical protein OGAPHI_004656 [Ogataea philodendri]|uniref:PH domain-containing protein n=1 Tax=Ogataea philodendri TaxID=1378263 RepID=A0A9P8P426_9ASCO|nr:uncharacterized protein OGAPHI_004656 [Ogataea philodendri]KAH3664304.1 hypothetical protein OGAPHI_004656 [Ogataea philodendri]